MKENGFNIDLIKISPKAHIVTPEHIEEDLEKLNKAQGTTSRGIAPCYSDKYKRIGKQAKDIEIQQSFIWNEKLYGNVLCEGAQGFWLDINQWFCTESQFLSTLSCSFWYSFCRALSCARIFWIWSLSSLGSLPFESIREADGVYLSVGSGDPIMHALLNYELEPLDCDGDWLGWLDWRLSVADNSAP